MNNLILTFDDKSVNPKETRVRIGKSGNLKIGTIPTSKKTYTNLTTFSPKSRQDKGHKGIHSDARAIAKDCLVTIKHHCLMNNLALFWTTLTFAHLPKKILDKLARKVNEVRAIIRDILVKIGYYFLVIIGIQNKATHSKRLPCYDYNIFSPYEYVTDDVIKHIFYLIGKLINERIKLPSPLNRIVPYNELENLKELMGYGIDNQVKYKENLEYIKSLNYKPLNTWDITPSKLKEESKPVEIIFKGDRVSDINNVLREDGYVIGKNFPSGNAAFKNNLTNYDPKTEIDKLKTTLDEWQ